AATGERAARDVVDRYLDRFGRALANVIDVLDPDVVVLGGGLSKLEALYDCGRAAVARYVFNDELTTPIVPNRLGDSAGVIGAAQQPVGGGGALLPRGEARPFPPIVEDLEDHARACRRVRQHDGWGESGRRGRERDELDRHAVLLATPRDRVPRTPGDDRR